MDLTFIDNPFYEFAAILIISAILGAIGRFLKQPLIVTFIAVGILVGPSGLDFIDSEEKIELLSEIGIAVLLFVVGLKLDLNLIKTTGPVALFTGMGQIIFTSALGYVIALSLGFEWIHALYIAVALTFSSTIIIVKMLSDKKELDQLHGQIAMGILIVQDIIVVLVMIVLSAFGAGEEETNLWNELLMVFLKGIAFFLMIGVLMKWAIPWVVHKLAHSKELLILSSIAWAVSLASLGDYLGFSKEVGAFLAGISLASTDFKEVISGRLGSIRDFLLLFFFIDLGSQINLSTLGEQIVPALVFSIFVMVGKPIIVMIIMGLMGYRKRTGFLAGFTLAQISEFSLILASLGLGIGHIDEDTMGMITLVGLITIGISTYMILYSGPIYSKLAPVLKIFEKKHPTKEEHEKDTSTWDYLIIGIGRFGENLAQGLIKKDYKVMVVDFNPDKVQKWSELGISAEYGDAEDPELPSLLPVKNIKNIISTAPHLEGNIRLLKFMKENHFKGQFIIIANDIKEEEILKKHGADYILHPFIEAAEVLVEKLDSYEQEENKIPS